MSAARDDDRHDPGPPGAGELPPDAVEAELGTPLAERPFAEALRATPELADIAVSLLLVAFPEKRLAREAEGQRTVLYTEPPLAKPERRRLLDLLFELVERPEWRERCAVAREVRDVRGTRLELLVPLAPDAYDGGEALVGPFEGEEEAQAWAAGIAEPSLAFDTVPCHGRQLVDLFPLGELLGE